MFDIRLDVHFDVDSHMSLRVPIVDTSFVCRSYDNVYKGLLFTRTQCSYLIGTSLYYRVNTLLLPKYCVFLCMILDAPLSK